MGGSSYPKDWSNSYNNMPSYTYIHKKHSEQALPSNENITYTHSLKDLIKEYTSSNIHKGDYSLSSTNEIKSFFKLIDKILISFKKINRTQAELLEDKFKQIKSLYRHYKLSIINSYYISLSSKTRLDHSNKDISIKIELDNFIYWLDNVLQVYDLLPDATSKEYPDGR